MSFFDFFRRKKAPAPEPVPLVQLPDGRTVSQTLADYLPKLETLALPCIRIEATPSDNLFQFDSKFGGHPYWPKDKVYPVDSFGNYMYPLAQLNFSQIPHLEGYPEKGLLQFYIAADDMYGLNVDNPTAQTNFRVVYFEDTTEPPVENFHFLDSQQRESDLPLKGQMQLSFKQDTDYFSFSDVRLPEERLDKVMTDLQPGEEYRRMEDELSQAFPDNGHKIGGYAYFTQTDPREDHAGTSDWVLLLQIDSQGSDICWGDYGVGNFFIHPDDLRRKDFSKVLYNWDCT
ncbi:MAG: DUF1963 domain-containing protein [Chitinophagaceae bacterium]|nr:MAG: DUF1963 domain-containing protein [Chitinophagaceae bacterium]